MTSSYDLQVNDSYAGIGEHCDSSVWHGGWLALLLDREWTCRYDSLGWRSPASKTWARAFAFRSLLR
ncbi:hypothetical protein MesoLj131b_77300 (plasmid) [Mesorhizobium sp. 131-2-5]|nr:hypothetical protein MesoLj131b_77300 [Mesorhizobium sp. 131-2-5]